ncbi:arsenate reductase ArsC [bacterium]|nr:arsenate reductase ArsC [bacterium]
MRSVLFVCTHNSARSQMAEALLRRHAGDRYDAMSAGLAPVGLHPLAVRVMREIGIDISGQQSKSLEDFSRWAFVDYAIVVCETAERECPGPFPSGIERLYWPFEDPAALVGTEEDRLARFRQVRDAIQQRIRDWLDEKTASA